MIYLHQLFPNRDKAVLCWQATLLPISPWLKCVPTPVVKAMILTPRLDFPVLHFPIFALQFSVSLLF